MSKITTGQMYSQWEQMNQKLEALDNKIDGIIDGTTPANTQVTGSNVELEEIYNNAFYQGLMDNEIMTLSKQGSELLNIKKTKNRVIVIQNLHDVPVRVIIQTKTTNEESSLTGPTIIEPQVVPSGGRLEISGASHPELNAPMPYLRVRLSREVQPQTGRLLIYIAGSKY